MEDELDQYNYYDHQLIVTNSTYVTEYGETYVLGAMFTYTQVHLDIFLYISIRYLPFSTRYVSIRYLPFASFELWPWIRTWVSVL